ncbi:hypothetical protein ABMA57_15305 [Saccharospirillum sp. HFRX-1]|uniref:hypothetical protein n=1 Tax=unclassified Saccharospirillum TaxID=2633430 RepID=UPI0037103391
MTTKAEALSIAEHYLKEMLAADDNADFELFTQRYEDKYLQGFTPEVFNNDIQQMQQRNGRNQGYEFLSELRNERIDDLDIYRTAWKGIYEKRDALVEIGVYQKDGHWYVIRSAVF